MKITIDNIIEEENIKYEKYEKMVKEANKYKDQLREFKASDDYKSVQYLKKQGLQHTEIKTLIKGLKKGKPVEGRPYKVGKNHVRYISISDTHIGNKEYMPGLMTLAAKVADENDVDFIVHAGDIFDGWYQNRPSSIFEQDAVGVDQQLKKGVKELSKFNKPIYFITGNHEHNTFYRSAGLEIGEVLEKYLKDNNKDVHFLGNAEGSIFLKGGAEIRLLHPDGGSSYAISYKSQKIAEGIVNEEGDNKPEIVHIGHFHKSEFMDYMNMYIFQAGCLEGRTKFMRGKSLKAMAGFWMVDVYSNNNGEVTSISPTWYRG